MDAQQHTPGPWAVYDAGDLRLRPGIEADDIGRGFSVIVLGIPDEDQCGIHGRVNGEAEANARLIAAAPDLLAAAKAIADFCDDPAGGDGDESLALGLARLLPATRAAIAKAEGRSA